MVAQTALAQLIQRIDSSQMQSLQVNFRALMYRASILLPMTMLPLFQVLVMIQEAVISAALIQWHH